MLSRNRSLHEHKIYLMTLQRHFKVKQTKEPAIIDRGLPARAVLLWVRSFSGGYLPVYFQ
jgi:hypothetical protein